MAGDVTNLRLWRKAKARQEKKAAGDRNAAEHGIPKPVAGLARARTEQARRQLDAHRLEPPGRDLSDAPDESGGTGEGGGA